MPRPRPDLIILGGGLAGGLCALALAERRPEFEIVLVEPAAAIGGNHLWSFFTSDVAPSHAWLVEPLIAHRWPGYDVAFPAHRRCIEEPYRTIESERLDAAVRRALPAENILRATAKGATATSVTLSDGRTIEANAVLDARGLGASVPGMHCGWQKFFGQLLRIEAGHGIDRPMVMDATVDQSDGYRFVYCLPFSSTDVFVEDTYYSTDPSLDPGLLRSRIAEYASSRGWTVAAASREEAGVLPVVTGGDFDMFWQAEEPVARAGVRAALFHPLTSYSLPDAVRFACWLADEAPLDGRLAAASRARAASHWQGGGFDRMLARMLFHAAAPKHRYRVLERFYRLPAPLIARFYAGRSTLFDKVRILSGRPPVSLPKALSAMLGKM